MSKYELFERKERREGRATANGEKTMSTGVWGRASMKIKNSGLFVPPETAAEWGIFIAVLK